MRFPLALTPRLTIVFVLFATVLLAAVGLLSYSSGRAALQTAALSELLSTALEKETALDGWVAERLADLTALADSPSLRGDVANLAAPGPRAARAAHDRALQEMQPHIGPKYLELFVLEPKTGKILVSTKAGEEGKSKRSDPYFENGKNGPFVKNPYFSRTLKAPAMTMSTPIRSAGGQLLGVLVARLHLSEISAIIQQRTGLRRTDDAYLVNPEGQFVTQPRFAAQSVVLHDHVRTEAVKRVLARHSGVFFGPDYRSVPAIVVYRWLPKRQLGLIVKMEQAEALAPAHTFGRAILVISGLALLAASTLALGLARSITRPVRALQAGVARFGQGALDMRLPEASGDELGLLAREFNNMAVAITDKEAQLRANAAQLEQRVLERTAQLEAAKREVEQTARANRNMLEYSQDVICSVDEAGRFINVSAACQRVWGYAPEELRGHFYIEWVHPDDVEKTNQAARNIMSGHTAEDFENRYLRQDGSIAHMMWSARWSDAEKSIFCVARDITERKRTEEELRASEERTRLIVDTAYDAYIAMDAAGLVIDWNRQAEAIFGWSRVAALGQPVHEMIIPPQYREAHVRGLRHFLATGEGPVLHKPIEITALRRDGHEFPVELTISPVRWGETHIFSAFLRDITERKRVEAELLQAKESAEAANRAKSDFLANMSHEIRTPMNGVLGPIGLLLDTRLAPQQHELAQIARSSAESLLAIINDILDLSKMEVGKLTIEPIPFNLLLAVEEVASMMAPRAEEKGLDIIVRYAPDVPRGVIGDPGRIRQVLANLVSNAIKFTASGHVLINVESSGMRDEGRGMNDNLPRMDAVVDAAQAARQRTVADFHPSSPVPHPLEAVSLRVSVEDTGIGIEAEKIQHVFGRFNQADTSTTRRYGGTGLGLAISEQLVELMDGEIGANSVPGEGSTFWFTLRLPRQSDEPVISLPDADLTGLRVLIVDDNEVNRRVLHEQITNWKMRNGSYASAPEALAALREAHASGDPFAIAILDHQMPDMDGEMLGHAIKADPALRETVLVMLTSLGRKGDATRLKQAGFAAYLLKPARQSELLGALTYVWATRNAGRPTELVTRHSIAETQPARMDRAAGTATRWAGTRALVAEDNIVNQKVATMILQSFGCHVEVAANGKEAIQMIEALPYDIVFMDCEMPEMDGYEATAEIRLRPDGKRGIPIIAVTAKATRGDRERCLAAGMDDYISKPVKAEDFQAALERWAAPRDEGRGMRAENGAMKAQVTEEDATAHPASLIPHPLDHEVVAQLRSLAEATDASLLAQIFDAFLSDGRARMTTLREAADSGDAARLYHAAHALKGASANIGARHMAEICEQLQALGESGSVAGAGDLIEELDGEFGRVQGEIKEQLQGPSS